MTPAQRDDPPPPAAPAARRWLAHPWLSLTVAASWLLLQGSLDWPHLIWAALLGLLLPWLAHDFIGAGSRMRRPILGLKLAGIVLWDILQANLTVARIVLDPRVRPRPAWLRVPYSLTDPRGVVLLATIITTTPGTVSCLIDEERRQILVHALDAADPDAVVADIVQRYEQPLKEIFG
jgi:multicomponent K+:H+ antiporter subunit E